jgi:hypothetical protein
MFSPLQTLANWRIVEQNGWTAVPFALGATGLFSLIALMALGARQATEEASLTPHQPAPTTGEPGRADLTY